MKRHSRCSGTKKGLVNILKYGSLIAVTIAALAPILLAVITSFKAKNEIYELGVLQLPSSLQFGNYATAFVEGNMLRAFFNTIIMVSVSLLGAIVNGTMVAYVLSRFEFKGKVILKNAFLFASLIPSMTIQVMIYQTISSIGVFNTRLAGILLYIGTDIISIYIFLQYLDSVSVSLDESAMLDGASYIMIYRKIIMPLLKPAIATVIIIKGVAIYNDFYIPYQYMPKPALRVIATSLFQFKGQYGTQWEIICAGVIITIIPILVIFILLQKHIYNGLTVGAVK